jgi:ubiquitin carboxyl-terminal hydrolase 5/13
LNAQDEAGITPRSFKSLVGEGHPEFSTNRQQDAAEFFQYLLQLIERHEHAKGDHVDVSKLFQFNTEDRLQCTRSNQVRYSYVEQNMLSVGIPLELAVNKDEVAAYEAAENGKSAEQKEKEKLYVQPNHSNSALF